MDVLVAGQCPRLPEHDVERVDASPPVKGVESEGDHPGSVPLSRSADRRARARGSLPASAVAAEPVPISAPTTSVKRGEVLPVTYTVVTAHPVALAGKLRIRIPVVPTPNFAATRVVRDFVVAPASPCTALGTDEVTGLGWLWTPPAARTSRRPPPRSLRSPAR